MRIRHFIIIPFIALMLIFGLASFDKGQLDNLSIITCLEIWQSDDDIFHIKAEVADGGNINGGGGKSGSEGGESSGGKKTSGGNTLTAEGTSLQKAYKNLAKIDSGSIYTGHVRLILFDINTADAQGFRKLSDFILDTEDIRFNVPIALYDQKTGDILEAETFVSGNKGLDLCRGLRNALSKEENVNIEAFQLINSIGENLSLSFPVISIKKMGDRSIAYVDDTAFYQNGKFIKRASIKDGSDPERDTGTENKSAEDPEDSNHKQGGE